MTVPKVIPNYSIKTIRLLKVLEDRNSAALAQRHCAASPPSERQPKEAPCA